NHMGINQRRAHPRPAMRNSSRHCAVADDGVSPIYFFKMEVWKTGNQTRDITARGLNFDGHRNGVPVIFHEKNNRKPQVGSGIHRLPEFAFTGSAITERNVGDFIAMELHILEFAIIAACLLPRVWVHHEIAAGLSASDGMKNLR